MSNDKRMGMRILAAENAEGAESRKIICGFSAFAVLVKNVAQPNAVKFSFIISRPYIFFMANLLFLRI